MVSTTIPSCSFAGCAAPAVRRLILELSDDSLPGAASTHREYQERFVCPLHRTLLYGAAGVLPGELEVVEDMLVVFDAPPALPGLRQKIRGPLSSRTTPAPKGVQP